MTSLVKDVLETLENIEIEASIKWDNNKLVEVVISNSKIMTDDNFGLLRKKINLK